MVRVGQSCVSGLLLLVTFLVCILFYDTQFLKPLLPSRNAALRDFIHTKVNTTDNSF